jgi:hypothetical protein
MITQQTSSKLQSIINIVLALSPQEQFQVIMVLLQNIFGQQQTNETIPQGRSLTTIIGTGRGSFTTSEQADSFIRAERDAWTS